jgi:hypothetical protein
VPPCLITIFGNWPEKLIIVFVWPYIHVFNGVHVAQFLAFCVVLCGFVCPFVPFLVAIVLSVLSFSPGFRDIY